MRKIIRFPIIDVFDAHNIYIYFFRVRLNLILYLPLFFTIPIFFEKVEFDHSSLSVPIDITCPSVHIMECLLFRSRSEWASTMFTALPNLSKNRTFNDEPVCWLFYTGFFTQGERLRRYNTSYIFRIIPSETSNFRVSTQIFVIFQDLWGP